MLIAERVHSEGLIDEMVRRKFHAAFEMYPIRNELTSHGKETWGEVFERVYQEPIEDYVKRANAQGLRDSVTEYEDLSRPMTA